jgi:hypothetical protein
MKKMWNFFQQKFWKFHAILYTFRSFSTKQLRKKGGGGIRKGKRQKEEAKKRR